MNRHNALSQRLIRHFVVLNLVFCSTIAFAGEKEDAVIDRALNAYGGDKLQQLKNLTYSDHISHFFDMQSGHALQGAMTTHLNNYQIELSIDLVNQRKVFKRATTRLVGNHGKNNLTTTHRIFSDNQGYAVDDCTQQYQLVKGIQYDNADAGYAQMLEPLIIRELAQTRENSRWLDTAYIQGKAHDVLRVNTGTKNEYTLYIARDTGYLSRMLKERAGAIRSYDFLQQQKQQGITWAKQLLVSTVDKPLYHSQSRDLSFNQVNEQAFRLPLTYQVDENTPVPVDVSKMTIRELAKNVYFIGQDWGYSLFVDVGDYYVSAGAWHFEDNSDAWQQALKLLQQTTKTKKNVKQHIVSHHHTDHMSSLHDVIKHGANLVLQATDIDSVNNHLDKALPDDKYTTVVDKQFIAESKIQLIDVPTSHASHNLVMYLPEQKLIFSEDIFGSSYQGGFDTLNRWPNLDTYQRLAALTDKIQAMGLEVNHYVSSHHARVLSQADIDKAMTLTCPTSNELRERLLFSSEM